MQMKRRLIGGALLPAMLTLAACGPKVQVLGNNPVVNYQEGSSPAAVQAREDVANGTARAIPNPSTPASAAAKGGTGSPGPSAASRDMGSMPGMDMGASAAANASTSPAASASPSPAANAAQTTPKLYD